jgi:hypothetical protein
MALHTDVHQGMQKKAKHLKIAFSFIKSSESSPPFNSISLDYPDNFQPGTPTSSYEFQFKLISLKLLITFSMITYPLILNLNCDHLRIDFLNQNLM